MHNIRIFNVADGVIIFNLDRYAPFYLLLSFFIYTNFNTVTMYVWRGNSLSANLVKTFKKNRQKTNNTLITFLFRTYIDISIIYPIICMTILICGFGTGAMYSLPVSMYADAIAIEEYYTGESKSGEYLGYYSFTYNLSNSISLLIMGFLLDLIKFDSSAPVQQMSVQTGLGSIVFCGCSIALSISILIFSKYKVKRSDVLKIQLKINEKKK